MSIIKSDKASERLENGSRIFEEENFNEIPLFGNFCLTQLSICVKFYHSAVLLNVKCLISIEGRTWASNILSSQFICRTIIDWGDELSQVSAVSVEDFQQEEFQPETFLDELITQPHVCRAYRKLYIPLEFSNWPLLLCHSELSQPKRDISSQAETIRMQNKRGDKKETARTVDPAASAIIWSFSSHYSRLVIEHSHHRYLFVFERHLESSVWQPACDW